VKQFAFCAQLIRVMAGLVLDKRGHDGGEFGAHAVDHR